MKGFACDSIDNIWSKVKRFKKALIWERKVGEGICGINVTLPPAGTSEA
jgi:hypothetical protein